MTNINITHINQIEKYSQFPYVVEISAWIGCGQSNFWGANSANEARDILAREIKECKKWAEEEIFGICRSDGYPRIAEIYVRPDADEDGDIADLSSWETL